MAPPLTSYVAVVLAGGRASRLDGADKASVEVHGRTLLARTLDAVVDAAEVVVVGEQVPTEQPATFVLEDPRHGGPVAALLAGTDVLLRPAASAPYVVVLAVDMPLLTSATVRRLHDAAVSAGGDGSVLVGPDGRRQLALVLHRDRLAAVAPGREERHGASVRSLTGDLALAEVPAEGDEHRDVDTWADLRDLA